MKEVMTVGGGCYWCLEAFFQRVVGVESVVSGYSGGTTENPTSMDVYSGSTGHAEVVQLTFNPSAISYHELLEIFFVMHDPTTLNRQGNDVGDLYRSIIFYHSSSQMQTAMHMINGFATKLWHDPVVTILEKMNKFWPAGPDAQNFYNLNPNNGYCRVVIDPKIKKLRQKFASKLKNT
ncbi:peptide-methionine (S)-S-oxide reductase MsrA [Candidatus Saccharibacteria bacterium]|jgi:peptide-methionine (S)-S-oxide reductase|nr:peptide-methionine (S)-S-oxide reductase MsrA [Candidatus Saccharibacteria bacterium]